MPAETLAVAAPEPRAVERQPAYALSQLVCYFLKLGTIGFGGAVIVLGRRSIVDVPTAILMLATLLVLWRWRTTGNSVGNGRAFPRRCVWRIFPRMRTPFGHRFLALLLSLAAGLAGPSTALAHGLAHSRLAHAAEHARIGIVADSHQHAREGEATLTHPDGPDHPHPRIEVAPTARVDVLVTVAVLVVAFAWPEPVASPAPPISPVGRLPSSRPPGSPPPSLRAPPLV